MCKAKNKNPLNDIDQHVALCVYYPMETVFISVFVRVYTTVNKDMWEQVRVFFTL